jgi:hypothetical protein
MTDPTRGRATGDGLAQDARALTGDALTGDALPGLAALCAALRPLVRGGLPEAETRRALAPFCTALRARGLAGQHVVLGLHAAWASLPEARAIDGAGVLTLRSRLVSAGIETFYAPSPPPG